MKKSFLQILTECGPKIALEKTETELEDAIKRLSSFGSRRFGPATAREISGVFERLNACREAWEILSWFDKDKWRVPRKKIYHKILDIECDFFGSSAWKEKFDAWVASGVSASKKDRAIILALREKFASSREEKLEMVRIERELDSLSKKFAQNVEAGYESPGVSLMTRSMLKNMDKDVVREARLMAKRFGERGWRFKNSPEHAYEILMHCPDRSLRKKAFMGLVNVAPENSKIADKMLSLRRRTARISGKRSPVSSAMKEGRMANDVKEVRKFLSSLSSFARPLERLRRRRLGAEGRSRGIGKVMPWDESFLAKRDESDEWFPLEASLSSLFDFIQSEFGLSFKRNVSVKSWRPTARCWNVFRQGKKIACLWIDPFSSKGKDPWYWSSEVASSHSLSESEKVRDLVISLELPFKSWRGAGMTRYGLSLLAHEMGHAMHFACAEYPSWAEKVDLPDDVVELPSLLLENLAWNEQFVSSIKGATVSKFPKGRLSSSDISAAVADSVFDIDLHGANKQDLSECYKRSRVFAGYGRPLESDRSLNTFSHVFAGSYGSSLYSYLWAEGVSSQLMSMEDKNKPGFFKRIFETLFWRPLGKGFRKEYEKFVSSQFSWDFVSDEIHEG